jgi:mannose-6-phosphate isomerase
VIPEKARFMDRGIETALDVFNFDPVPPTQIDAEFRCIPTILNQDDLGNTLEQLIGPDKTSCFTVKRATVKGLYQRTENEFFFGVMTAGSGTMRIGDEIIELLQWERFFCPAGVTDFAYESDSGMTILECYPGSELK